MSSSGESTLSTFVASDGDNIVIQDWPLDSRAKLRGVVILVHGLGEHAGRYEHVAEQLNSWGFAVRGYDQCGHGESGGLRGSLPTDTRLLDDLADIVDSTRARMPKDTPLIVLGHSMGGLVAARFVSLAMRPVDGLVLSSPALDPGLNPVQKMLLAVLPKIFPNLRVGNGVKPQFISHDPAVVAAYRADRQVHDRISGRLGRFIATAGAEVLAVAPQLDGTDLACCMQEMIDCSIPRAVGALLQRLPPAVVTAVCFESLYHEIFNELDAEPVFAGPEAVAGRKILKCEYGWPYE